MKIPERVVEAAARKLADVLFDAEFEGDAASEWRRLAQLTTVAITAALQEWIASGEASLKCGSFTSNGGYHYTSLTDDRSHPVLIIRMEQK